MLAIIPAIDLALLFSSAACRFAMTTTTDVGATERAGMIYHVSPNPSHARPSTVGIVGGGIAGLYTALLLQREGIKFHIFEGTNRVGGRVLTHYFNVDKDQYYEAGAMRIPQGSPFQKIFFDLVNYVNECSTEDRKIELIEYVLNMPGNELFVNNVRPQIESNLGPIASAVTPAMVKWHLRPEDEPIYANKSASDLMKDAIGPLLNFLTEKPDEFERRFLIIVDKFDNYSFRFYLGARPVEIPCTCSEEEKKDTASRHVLCKNFGPYPTEVIDFLETVTSQSNQFALSVPELVMQSLDFGVKNWKTIKSGMSRLPEAMAELVGLNHITFGARATCLQIEDQDPHVTLTAQGVNGELCAKFDCVVLAIPPAALKMLVSRPRWSPGKEIAIRSIHFEALYKMGLRFKKRFWERVEKPSLGGQSTTDLPIRWIVFPSNGMNSDGTGVLLVYAWMTDANTWLPLSPVERRSLALHNLEEMYKGRLGKNEDGEDITVADLFIESHDAAWSESTATGDAMFLPGQFESRFNWARQPENGKFYFAGEHISYHHTWIAGAADSALWTASCMLNKALRPLSGETASSVQSKKHDIMLLSVSFDQPKKHDIIKGSFKPFDPLRLGQTKNTFYHSGERKLPRSLGDGDHGLGADMSRIYGLY